MTHHHAAGARRAAPPLPPAQGASGAGSGARKRSVVFVCVRLAPFAFSPASWVASSVAWGYRLAAPERGHAGPGKQKRDFLGEEARRGRPVDDEA